MRGWARSCRALNLLRLECEWLKYRSKILAKKQKNSGLIPELEDGLVEAGESRTPRPEESYQNRLQA